jgi:anthranilate synthase component 1
MKIEPAFEAFEPGHREGRPQVVWTRLVADLETPVSTMLKLAEGRRDVLLLESVEGGNVRGRYSMIGLDPDLVWRASGPAAEVDRRPGGRASRFEPCAGDTLTALRALLAESAIDLPDELPPMAAGVFGYMGYDTVELMEDLPGGKPDPVGLPDAMFVRPSVMVIFDAVKDELTVVAPVRPDGKLAARGAYDRAVDRLTEIVEALDRPLPHRGNGADVAAIPAPVSNTSAEAYQAMVRRAKAYIEAGDVFQVVLSQRFAAPFALPPFALYRALRRVNPSPFLFYLALDDFAVIGSSPEILVRARDGRVTIRPIAGTRPRGATPAEDREMAASLLADPKERAEHLMLLDLGRNDVGRVAEIGSVEVTDQFFLEHYSHVMHIVSNVEGDLSPGKDAIDALVAGFPAGTVSGAPKVRAMEIIHELEADRRGIYAGCVGYFSAAGDMDTCIVLRTAVVKDGTMYVQAGAGIVADSDPASEQAECIAKARALFRAADEAVAFASEAARGQ